MRQIWLVHGVHSEERSDIKAFGPLSSSAESDRLGKGMSKYPVAAKPSSRDACIHLQCSK